MRVLFIGMVAGVVGVACWSGESARADDGIAVQMRVEGTIPKADDPIGKPFVKQDQPYAVIPGGHLGGGELWVVVTKDKTRALVIMSFGGDEKLKQQAEKLAGRRVVVECKGEYKLSAGKVEYELNWVRYKQDVAYANLSLTVTKIEVAK